MAYQLEFTGGVLRLRMEGVVPLDDLTKMFSEISAFEHGRTEIPDRITDLSGVIDFVFGFNGMHATVAPRREVRFPNNFRSAIVAPTPIAMGFARMFQTLNSNEQIEVRVFSALDQAEAWLSGS